MLFYIAHLCTCAIKVCAEDSVKSYFVENEIIKSVSCGSHNRICNYNYWSIRSQFSGLQGMRTAKKKGQYEKISKGTQLRNLFPRNVSLTNTEIVQFVMVLWDQSLQVISSIIQTKNYGSKTERAQFLE